MSRMVCPNTVKRMCLELPRISDAEGRLKLPRPPAGFRRLAFLMPSGGLIAVQASFDLKDNPHIGCDCGWDGYETSSLYRKLKRASDDAMLEDAGQLARMLE